MKLLPTYYKPQLNSPGLVVCACCCWGPGRTWGRGCCVTSELRHAALRLNFSWRAGRRKYRAVERLRAWELRGGIPRRHSRAKVTENLKAQKNSKTQNSAGGAPTRGPGPKSQIPTRPQSPYVHMGSLNFATAGSSQSRGTPRVICLMRLSPRGRDQ